MVAHKVTVVFISTLMAALLSGCIPEPVLLNGDIKGTVADAESGQPIPNVSLRLKQSGVTLNTTSSDSDGIFLFHNLTPGMYNIELVKESYLYYNEFIEVETAMTKELFISLTGTASLNISDNYLDYGVERSVMSLIITNGGTGKVQYSLIPGKDWINIDQLSGNVTDEKDSVNITLDRSELSSNTYKETVSIIYNNGEELVTDSVIIYVNGVLDQDDRYYRAVKIGEQIWMAENLNKGTSINFGYNSAPTDNGHVEKYCYDNLEASCGTYGGLYTWHEMMDYPPSDTGITGITQGVCPDGWHIPSPGEWREMIDFLGGELVAGRKLKDTSPLWRESDFPGDNESGLSALPGGNLEIFFGMEDPENPGVIPWTLDWASIEEFSYFWTDSAFQIYDPNLIEPYYIVAESYALAYNYQKVFQGVGYPGTANAYSVRCIED